MSISPKFWVLILWGKNKLGRLDLGGDNTTNPRLGSLLSVAKQPVANQTS